MVNIIVPRKYLILIKIGNWLRQHRHQARPLNKWRPEEDSTRHCPNKFPWSRSQVRGCIFCKAILDTMIPGQTMRTDLHSAALRLLSIILVFASVFLRLLLCGLPFGDGICFCCASVSCFYYLCLLMWVMCAVGVLWFKGLYGVFCFTVWCVGMNLFFVRISRDDFCLIMLGNPGCKMLI